MDNRGNINFSPQEENKFPTLGVLILNYGEVLILAHREGIVNFGLWGEYSYWTTGRIQILDHREGNTNFGLQGFIIFSE